MVESTTMASMKATPIGQTETLKRLAAQMPAGTRPAPDDGRPWNVETEEDAAERRAVRAQALRARWELRRPSMYADARPADLDANQHAAKVALWAASGSCHLVLAGPVGTGKTFAAYAIGNVATELGMVVEAWTVHDLMTALRPNGDAEGAARAVSADLLILDDLDGTATEWEAETLTALLDARVREERRTIVTTNVTGDQITEAWGSRLMDRLRYKMTALTFVGESRRKADW